MLLFGACQWERRGGEEEYFKPVPLDWMQMYLQPGE